MAPESAIMAPAPERASASVMAPMPTSLDCPVPQDVLIGAPPATQEGVPRSRKRALRQAEKTRSWKCARAQSPTDSEPEPSDGEYPDYVSEEDCPVSAPSVPVPSTSSARDTVSGAALTDPAGEPLFNPDILHHPRSAEWAPSDHIAKYLEHWVRQPLSKEARSKLRAECPRPLVPNKVCETPVVDPKMSQFLAKSGWSAKKGIDSALRSCQDKLLDVFGPLTKIFELAESARAENAMVDPEELRGWVQRAICVAGNANASLTTERRKSILFRIDPKLSTMALNEPGKEAQGLLFGDSFIKELGKFVGTFTALDKAQASMRKVFSLKVSPRAGSGRGRLSGRAQYQSRGTNRGSFSQRQQSQDYKNPSPFFPSRGGRGQSRPFRGTPSFRRSSGKLSRGSVFFGCLGRGSSPSFFQCLGGHHLRPVGARHRERVPHRTCGAARVPPSPSPTVLPDSRSQGRGRRIAGSVPEACHREVASRFDRSGQQHLPGPEERRPNAPGHQFAGFERDSSLSPLQDGGHPSVAGLVTARRLDGQARPQGRLPHCPHLPSVTGSSPIPVAGGSLAVHLPPLRPVFGPWCFTKLMRPAMAWLRSRGVRLIVYLDDILILHQSREALLTHLRWAMDLLSGLGFLINREKSCLAPRQEIEFLGFMVDSLSETLSLPTAKLRLIRKELRHALSLPLLSLRHLARLIGLLASSIQAVFPAPLHYRALQRLKIAHLRSGASYADSVVLDSESREEIRWWLANLEAWNGRAIFGPRPDVTIESDASLLGWGAHCNGISTGGRWSEAEASLHINALELLAGSFAVRSFANGTAHACIRLRMDNVSAVRYINKLGGTQSATLARLAREFWEYCLSLGLLVQAEYIPGLHNVRADFSSRYFSDGSDWRLSSPVFSAISSIWGPFQVDLFASRLNTQLPRFFSWRPDPHAEAVDAFLQDWSGGLHYAFPPFAMIPRTLWQTRRQGAELVLIAPFWGSQVWFPSLLELMVDIPLLLPRSLDLLYNQMGSPHPLLVNGSLSLLACRLSGRRERSRVFRTQLDASSITRGLPAPENLTGLPGELGLLGAWNGTWIPFQLL